MQGLSQPWPLHQGHADPGAGCRGQRWDPALAVLSPLRFRATRNASQLSVLAPRARQQLNCRGYLEEDNTQSPILPPWATERPPPRPSGKPQPHPSGVRPYQGSRTSGQGSCVCSRAPRADEGVTWYPPSQWGPSCANFHVERHLSVPCPSWASSPRSPFAPYLRYYASGTAVEQNMAHIRQSRPDSGLGFQEKARKTF